LTDVKNIEEEIKEKSAQLLPAQYSKPITRKVSTKETSLEEERSKYTFGRPITTHVIN
jgi:hypothetical protein